MCAKSLLRLSKLAWHWWQLCDSRFVTILRHICHHSNIPFTTRIHYANNTYYITYYIKCVADASVNSADNVTNGGATRDASQETTV